MDGDSINVLVASKIGAQTAIYEADLKDSLDRLIKSGWVGLSEGTYKVEPEYQKIVRIYERRFDEMMAAFEKQVTIDAVNLFDVNEQTGPRFAYLLIETLIDIFQSRGREILRVAFEESNISPSGALELIETVWRRSSHLPDPSERPTFVRFVLTTMFEPKGIYENVLNYFAKAFFCIQALGANKATNRIVSDIIGDRAILIDANILIPLTARYEDRHEFIVAVVEACRAAGIHLYTTQLALDEVRRHARWALNLTQQFGTISNEVLHAATGQSDYEANAFLKGFITLDPDSRDRSFLQYIRDCFGGSFTYNAFHDFFPDQLGITVLQEETMREVRKQHRQAFDEAVSQIAQWDLRRKDEKSKSDLRIESEAEAFIAVTRWNTIRDLMMAGTGSKCSYMTYGTTVGRLGGTLRGSTEMVSVPPEVIWEILTTLDGGVKSGLPEFRSLMSASYFRMSDHFIDKERYRTFFRPVIDAAKAKLQGMHPFVQDILGVALTDEHLDGYAVEDLPAVLSSVEGAASRKASLGEAITQKVMDENESLRAQIREYQEREAKRKEFVAEQRRRDKERQASRRRN